LRRLENQRHGGGISPPFHYHGMESQQYVEEEKERKEKVEFGETFEKVEESIWGG